MVSFEFNVDLPGACEFCWDILEAGLGGAEIGSVVEDDGGSGCHEVRGHAPIQRREPNVSGDVIAIVRL